VSLSKGPGITAAVRRHCNQIVERGAFTLMLSNAYEQTLIGAETEVGIPAT
jgi:hypothetical protein